MALASASAVTPAPIADNANIAAQNAVPGATTAAKFSETLESVLQNSFAQTKSAAGKADPVTADDTTGKIVKLKSKTVTPDTDAAAMMQTPVQKIMDTNPVLRGIDMNALRASLAQQETTPPGTNTQLPASSQPDAGTFAPDLGAQPDANNSIPLAATPGAHAQNPVAVQRNPDAGMHLSGPGEHTLPIFPVRGGSAATSPSDAASVATAKQTGTTPASSKTPSLETQARLAEALLKIASATPAGKASTAAPGVAKMAAALKASSAKPNAPKTTTLATDPNPAQMAAGAKPSPQSQAKAATDTKTASSATTITKIEMAAMTTASQEAVKTPAPQAKVEAQALPVNFDAAAKAAGDKNSNAQSGTDGKDSKSGSERTAASAPQPTDTPAMKIADAPQPQNAPAHSAPAPSTNIDTAGTGVSAPSAAAQNTVTLQVAPQTQHNAATDQPNLAALGVSIAAKSKDGEKQFDISMHPADLGRVEVRLSVDSDGKAQAHLVAEKPQTLQLLQNDRATLERSLKDAGLDLSNNGLNFSLKGEQQPSTPTFNARSHALSVAAVSSVDTASTTSHAGIASGNSRLDIRV